MGSASIWVSHKIFRPWCYKMYTSLFKCANVTVFSASSLHGVHEPHEADWSCVAECWRSRGQAVSHHGDTCCTSGNLLVGVCICVCVHHWWFWAGPLMLHSLAGCLFYMNTCGMPHFMHACVCVVCVVCEHACVHVCVVYRPSYMTWPVLIPQTPLHRYSCHSLRLTLFDILPLGLLFARQQKTRSAWQWSSTTSACRPQQSHSWRHTWKRRQSTAWCLASWDRSRSRATTSAMQPKWDCMN